MHNLGSNYMKKNTNAGTREADHENANSQDEEGGSYQTLFNQNTNDYQTILARCEYLESLNQNLVSENAKLKNQLESENRSSRHFQSEQRSNFGKSAWLIFRQHEQVPEEPLVANKIRLSKLDRGDKAGSKTERRAFKERF